MLVGLLNRWEKRYSNDQVGPLIGAGWVHTSSAVAQQQEVAAMPEEKKEIPVLITGIQLMKELSLDAHMMIYLASEGILMPFRRIIHESYMKLLLSCNSDTAIDKVTDWRYREDDVEEFKLKHKVYLEKLRLSRGRYPTAPEPQSDTAPETTERNDSHGSRVNERLAIALEFAKMLEKSHPNLTANEAAVQINLRMATEYKGNDRIAKGYSSKHLMKLIKPSGFKRGKRGNPGKNQKNN